MPQELTQAEKLRIKARTIRYKTAIHKNPYVSPQEKKNLIDLLQPSNEDYKDMPWEERFNQFDMEAKALLKRNVLKEISKDLEKEIVRMRDKYKTLVDPITPKKKIAMDRIRLMQLIKNNIGKPGYSVELLRAQLAEIQTKMPGTGWFGSFRVTGAGKIHDMIKKIDKVLQEPKPEKESKHTLRR